MERPTLTVLIVTYNSAGHIGAAVNSCVGQGLPVIVFDNASQDETLREVPESPLVTVIASPKNIGFAAGVNRAAQASNSSWLLLLNPDAELLDPIAPLAEFAAAKDCAAAGLLVDATGEPQRGFSVRRLPTPAVLALQALGINGLFPGNSVNRSYRCLNLDLTQIQPVEQPAGACLLFSRKAWTSLGGFDEDFFPLWFEDVDFCRRLLAHGQQIWLYPPVRVRHDGAHSIRKLDFALRQQYWHESMLRYARKHFPPPGRRLVAAAVFIALIPRTVAAGVMDSPVRAVKAFLSIFRAAWHTF